MWPSRNVAILRWPSRTIQYDQGDGLRLKNALQAMDDEQGGTLNQMRSKRADA